MEWVTARFAAECGLCSRRIAVDERIALVTSKKLVRCEACAQAIGAGVRAAEAAVKDAQLVERPEYGEPNTDADTATATCSSSSTTTTRTTSASDVPRETR